MNYLYKDKIIATKAEWEKAFNSAYNSKGQDIHWKIGRSGECLAEDFIGNEATGEESIVDMITRFLNTTDIVLETAKIEHPSIFDKHPRPRIQDLAIWGKADNKNIFVGVEAKVDEPFGSRTIAEQRKYVNGLTKTEANERLDELVHNYLNGNELKHGKLRYQLLYYLAGSFCEKNADIIFLPVIVYETRAKSFGEYLERKGSANKKAYKLFMQELGFGEVKNIIGGQILMAYYKKISISGVEKDVYSCYIVK